MATYTYPITAFPNDAVSLTDIESDIEDTISTSLSASVSHEGLVKITFFGVLTGQEQTDLDGIVAGHDGIETAGDAEPTYSIQRLNTFTSTASAYTDVLSLSASIPPGAHGDYRLSWFVLYGIDSGLVNFRMRLLQNHTETLMGYAEEVPNSDPDERIPRSGFIPLEKLKKGDYHWDLECGKESGGEEAWKVFKAFLELRRL